MTDRSTPCYSNPPSRGSAPRSSWLPSNCPSASTTVRRGGTQGVLTGLHLHTSLLTVEDSSDDRFGLLPADVENQKQMSELTKKKDQLSQTIDIYKSLFDTNRQLVTELNSKAVVLVTS